MIAMSVFLRIGPLLGGVQGWVGVLLLLTIHYLLLTPYCFTMISADRGVPALFHACLIRNAGLKREGDFQQFNIAAAVEGVFTRQSVRRAINGGSLRKIRRDSSASNSAGFLPAPVHSH